MSYFRTAGVMSLRQIFLSVLSVLFLNLMLSINMSRNLRENGFMLAIGCLAGIGLAALEIMRKKGGK